MTAQVRPPMVAGVGGGVGVTTLATALRGHDAGRAGVAAADILACRGTLDSLRRAAEVLDRLDGTPPVLAVSLDGARVPRGALRARLEQLDATTSGIVPLPLVKEWRTVDDPLPEAARLLVDPPEQLSRPLRSYADALRELAAAVAASGRLAVPPAVGTRTPPDDAAVRRRPGDEPVGRHRAPRRPEPGERVAIPEVTRSRGATPAPPRAVTTVAPVTPPVIGPVRRGVRIVAPAPVRPPTVERIGRVG